MPAWRARIKPATTKELVIVATTMPHKLKNMPATITNSENRAVVGARVVPSLAIDSAWKAKAPIMIEYATNRTRPENNRRRKNRNSPMIHKSIKKFLGGVLPSSMFPIKVRPMNADPTLSMTLSNLARWVLFSSPSKTGGEIKRLKKARAFGPIRPVTASAGRGRLRKAGTIPPGSR